MPNGPKIKIRVQKYLCIKIKICIKYIKGPKIYCIDIIK